MIEEAKRPNKSMQVALKLYDSWVRERRRRPSDLACSDSPDALKEVGLKNFTAQVAEPRRRQLQQMNRVGDQMTTPDKVALLVMTEIPALETSTLLQRLASQLMDDSEATYFSAVNMADNCGSGCG